MPSAEQTLTPAQAAEAFRELLRTQRYPEGSTIRGISEIRRATGVSHSTAQRALEILANQGELEVRVGTLSTVLPPPAYPLGSLNEIDRLLAELAGVVLRLQRAIHRHQKARRRERTQPDPTETPNNGHPDPKEPS